MTIVFDNTSENANRLKAYLNKLVNVIQVEDLTYKPMVCRDLALVKVAANTHNRTEIMQFVDTFRARIVDVASDSLVIEITGNNDKIQSFLKMMLPFGIQEFARSGAVGMARGHAQLSPSHQPAFQNQHLPEPVLVSP